MKNKKYVISLGGSLIVPKGGIDWKFLKRFRTLMLSEIKKGNTFFLITGGGATCREYNEAARKVIKTPDRELDWLGIQTTRLNAHLLKTVFYNIAHPEIILDPTDNIKTKKKLIIAGGWKPGWSTDYMAVMIAKKVKARTVINLSNIKYVYDKDPRKFKNVKKITDITWKDFRKIVGSKWGPGLNAPFDPIASKLAQRAGLEVIITEGRNINNLKKIFREEKFIGTVIKN